MPSGRAHVLTGALLRPALANLGGGVAVIGRPVECALLQNIGGVLTDVPVLVFRTVVVAAPKNSDLICAALQSSTKSAMDAGNCW